MSFDKCRQSYDYHKNQDKEQFPISLKLPVSLCSHLSPLPLPQLSYFLPYSFAFEKMP